MSRATLRLFDRQARSVVAFPTDASTKPLEVTIDIGWFGVDNPKRALIHSSGVHGVEAFAGAAIQLQWLDLGIRDVPKDGAIVVVHVVNPYGMSWLRRVNERNVDLNRNCLAPDEAYAGAPDGYDALNDFLNPSSGPPAHEWFRLRAAWLICRFGMPALKQAIAGGQYVNPKGLFLAASRSKKVLASCGDSCATGCVRSHTWSELTCIPALERSVWTPCW